MTAIQKMLFISTDLDDRNTVRRLLHSPRHKLNRVASEIGIENPWLGSKRDLINSIRKKSQPNLKSPDSPPNLQLPPSLKSRRKSKSKPRRSLRTRSKKSNATPRDESSTLTQTPTPTPSRSIIQISISDTTEDASRNKQAYLYQIEGGQDTNDLNGKTCRITQDIDHQHLSTENDDHCRVTVLCDGSSHLIPRSHLQRVNGSGHRRKKAVSISTTESEAEDTLNTLRMDKVESIESVQSMEALPPPMIPLEIEGSPEPTSAPEMSVLSDLNAEDHDNELNDDQNHLNHQQEEEEEVRIDVEIDIDIDVVAVAVFDVYYQMILSFMDIEMDYLFGTKFSSFKTECLRFLCRSYSDPEFHENDPLHSKYDDPRIVSKALGSCLIWHCISIHDKRILFLVREDPNHSIPHYGSRFHAMHLVIGCINAMEQRFDKMSESPMETIRHLWCKKDKFGLGELSCKEWHKFLKALTGDRDLKEAASRKMFDGIDVDKIRAITFSQMVKWMKEEKKTLWELLLELAKDYEVDSSAMLGYQQRALSQILGITLIAYETARDELWDKQLMEHIGWIREKQRMIDQQEDTRKYMQQCSRFVWNSTSMFDEVNDEEGRPEIRDVGKRKERESTSLLL